MKNSNPMRTARGIRNGKDVQIGAPYVAGRDNCRMNAIVIQIMYPIELIKSIDHPVFSNSRLNLHHTTSALTESNMVCSSFMDFNHASRLFRRKLIQKLGTVRSGSLRCISLHDFDGTRSTTSGGNSGSIRCRADAPGTL